MTDNRPTFFYLFSALLLFGSVASSSCSPRNLHRTVEPDTRLLVRQWTRMTHGPFVAGDRGSEYSNPVFFKNTLIFGNQSVGLVSLYPGLNEVRWALPIENGVVSELAVDEESIYFGGGDGYLYCINADNGRVRWRYTVRNPVISKPTVEGGRVLVTTSDDTVFALDSGSGQWLWHYRRRSSLTATILGASPPLVIGSEVIAGLSDGFLVALGLEDGKLKWEKKLHEGRKFTDVDAHPQLVGSTMYVPSYDGSLYALDKSKGDVLWKFQSGGSKDVSIEGNTIFLPSSDGNIYALRRDNGKLLWKFEMDGGVPTRLIVTERYIIFGSSFRYLYALDKVTGKPLYRWDNGFKAGFSGSPIYDEKTRRMFILSAAGNLYAFSVRPPLRKKWPRGQTDGFEFDVPGLPYF